MENTKTYKFEGRLNMPDNLEYDFYVDNINLSQIFNKLYDKEAYIEIVGFECANILECVGKVYKAIDEDDIECLHISEISIDRRLQMHTGELVGVKITTDIDLEELVYGEIHNDTK